MITAADVSVAANGNIRWTGTGAGDGPYTVLELHRYLQDLADNEEASGDDILDITSNTPSERSTDNIITLINGYNIDDTMAEHLYDGSVLQASGDTLYSGLVVVGALNSTTTLKIVQNNLFYDDKNAPFWGTGLNADAGNNILMRCLVKTRDTGADIDGKKVRVQARTFGDTYSEFSVTMGLGNSVAAIFTNSDLNNITVEGTVATWTGITNVEGYQGIDLNNGNGTRYYYSQWNRDVYTINQLYERTKWLSRAGSASTIYGMDGELFRGITHQWNYDTELGGPFDENEELTWGSGATAGSGTLLALLDSGTTGTMWIQLLSGIPPIDDMVITGDTSTATCAVNGAITTRSLSPALIGQSTGTAIIGAFGIGIEAADLTVSDKLFDLTNTLQQPPNNVEFKVINLVSGEDRVLVGPKGAGDEFLLNQLTLNGALTGGESTVVVQTSSVPADTPTAGTIRILGTDGVYHRVTYTGKTVSSFTGCTGAPAASNGANVWISYIDVIADAIEEGVTVVFDAPRNLFVRVRDGGGTPIKTFQSASSLGSGGGTIAAIRTSDV